jgi:hypothetical protein
MDSAKRINAIGCPWRRQRQYWHWRNGQTGPAEFYGNYFRYFFFLLLLINFRRTEKRVWMDPIEKQMTKAPLFGTERKSATNPVDSRYICLLSKREPLPPLSWNTKCSRGPEQATPFIGTAAANPLPGRRCTGANFCPMNGPNKKWRNLF